VPVTAILIVVLMNIAHEERECRKAIAAAEKLAAKVRAAVKDFPPEGKELGDKLVSAADRTVLNLKLALECLLKPEQQVM
jgi:hypothetical protein